MLTKRQIADSAVIIGIDEAGRGALAGPVTAGACFIPEGKTIPSFITDSKKLTPEKREEAFSWIETHCIYGVGSTAAHNIDAIGILAATERAMQEALAMLATQVTPTYLLVDGRDKFWFDYPHSSVIRGDESEPCISAGSIVAKVLRDRYMVEQAKTHPHYGFEGHKGYGSSMHIDAIKEHGVSNLHRKTFLRSILGQLSVPATTTV